MTVIKRDGTKVEYDVSKIRNAIEKANARTHEMSEEDVDRIVTVVQNKCLKTTTELTVEHIQDLVEDTLLKSRFNKTAKSYILYRDERSRNRENRTKLMQSIAAKLMGTNIVNQNANVDEHSFGGRKGEANSELMRWFALNNCMSEKSKENHINNKIYIHDLDSYAVGQHNCLSIPFDKLLRYGFNTRQTDIRPASSVGTAFQLVAVIFQLQSLQQFGGVSATHLDWTMVPFVRMSFRKHYLTGLKYFGSAVVPEISKETSITDKHVYNNERAYTFAMEETKSELHQAVEGMYHNLNTLQSRSGNQLPFTSINYGTCTLPEGRLVIEALLRGSLDGVGKVHRTPIFPCGIFQYKKGVNDKPGTPNYDLYKLALESTSKRLYPNYANVDWSVNVAGDEYDRKVRQDVVDSLDSEKYASLLKKIKEDPEVSSLLGLFIEDEKIVAKKFDDPKTYFSTMGCRTANGSDINFDTVYKKNIENALEDKKDKITFISANQKDGRGNIAPNTIILPELAMEAKNSSNPDKVEEFMRLLDMTIHDAKDELLERYDYMCHQDESSAKFMYENGTMEGYNKEEGIRSALCHGTLVIGQLGVAETLQILIGKNQLTDEGMTLAKRIEQLYKDRCAEFKNQYHLNFGVYYTPAECLCYTAMNKFKNKYGVIPNVSDREYFTNSIHVPVWEKVDPFEKIDCESQLTGYSNAGCITYVELEGAVLSNLEALESIVNYAMEKDIPYFAVNVPNDTCLDCGFTGEFNNVCPVCGSTNIQQLRRVTGYLTGNYTTAFNKGKQAEVKDRFKHSRKLGEIDEI